MRRSLAVAGVVAAGLLTACSSSPPGPHTATLTAVTGHSGATLNVLTGTALLTIGMANFGDGGALTRRRHIPPALRSTASASPARSSCSSRTAATKGTRPSALRSRFACLRSM